MDVPYPFSLQDMTATTGYLTTEDRCCDAAHLLAFLRTSLWFTSIGVDDGDTGNFVHHGVLAADVYGKSNFEFSKSGLSCTAT